MDFAMVSAAEAARPSWRQRAGNYTAAALAAYENKPKSTSIYKDWQTFKATYPLLENKRLFDVYPELACKVMEDLFSPTTQPGSKALAALREEMKGKVSMMDLAKDLYQISRGIAL
jgi:electron transfer flavoprotein-quinone oxidoreductase